MRPLAILNAMNLLGNAMTPDCRTHTDPKEIARRLRAPSKGSKIVFTTYQSSDKLAAATRRANIGFDLAILDEAHKTVGVRSKTFATLLRERKFKAQRRLFMTATERVFRGDSDEVLSMDNEADYGKCFFQLSYKEAIAQRIISDYKILTMTVSNERVAKVIKENRILNLRLRDLDEAEARAVATGVALKRVEKQGVTHAISFHSSIRAAERFRDQQDVLNRLRPRTTNLHISSKKTAGERADLLREFVGESRALMTNARCLTEGVDVPAIDCVVFADPKQSRIDIVQAAGRALRRYPGKDYGHILLPLVVPREMGFNEFAETTAFRQVARIVTALSTQDERIADEFRAVLHDRTSSGKIVEVCGDVPLGMHMSLGQFAKAISSRVWNSVGRANWRKFEDARAFVRSLKLEGQLDWAAYCSSGNKPADIPAAPEAVYANVLDELGQLAGDRALFRCYAILRRCSRLRTQIEIEVCLTMARLLWLRQETQRPSSQSLSGLCQIWLDQLGRLAWPRPLLSRQNAALQKSARIRARSRTQISEGMVYILPFREKTRRHPPKPLDRLSR